MTKYHRPMFLLILSKSQARLKKFLKGFDGMDDVILMPNNILGSTPKWHFIREAMDSKKKIVLYVINSTNWSGIEDEIQKISYHIKYQNNHNIQRVLLADGSL